MIREGLNSLLGEIEKIIEVNKSSAIAKIDFSTLEEIYERLNALQQKLKQDIQEGEYRQQLELFVHNIPALVAILDEQMCYVAVSDRWSEYFQLNSQNIIGRNYYEIFSQIPDSWRQGDRDCLLGKIKVINREEDNFFEFGDRADRLHWQVLPWKSLTGKITGLLILTETTTQKHILQKKIESCEAQMRSIFTGMNELVFTLDRSSNAVLFLPTKFFEVYSDFIVNQIIEQTYVRLFDCHENETENHQNLIDRVLQTQTPIEFEYSLQLQDSTIWYGAKISPTSPTTIIWVARDITERKEIERNNLFVEQELAQITLQSIGDGVIRTDETGHIQYINPTAERITGWRLQEVKGDYFTDIFQIVHQSRQQSLVDLIYKVKNKERTYKLTAKNILIARSGRKYAIEGTASPIKNRQNKLCGIVVVFRNVSHARKIAQQLSWQATHDPLTKLYNRRKFEEQVAKAIEYAKNDSYYYAVCYLDLDRFKIINDTCGHSAGDKLLCQITKLLQQRIRTSDIFARVGGDEFAILLCQCAIEQAIETARQLVEIVRGFRFIWEDKVFRIGVSVGVVGIDSQTDSLTSLLNAVDASCYAAKESGGNTVHVYHQEDLALVRQQTQRRWVEKINQALEENRCFGALPSVAFRDKSNVTKRARLARGDKARPHRFCLYTQKIVPIDKNLEIHYEVLLRLVEKSGKLIAPGLFLPAAERYGLMPAIDRWVVETFMSNYENYWRSNQQKIKPATNLYTINLSGASINNREFANFLKELFERYNIPPETICFEITETVAITNIEQAVVFIKQLKQLGCSIALDDFGSGMSSFNYLKHLPVDYLKIDGSFVQNIVNDKVDYATVECFHHISQIMNIKTIAEFVENESILDSLKQIGVDYVQGYGIEKPQPLTWT